MKSITTLLALALLVIAGTSSAAIHPLDGLSGEEYQKTTEILRQKALTDENTLFPLIELIEPEKSDVLAWSEDNAVDRRVRAYFKSGEEFEVAIVNLTDESVESSGKADGQPMVLFSEFITAMNAALGHPDMVSGLAKRNLTPDDVFCLPLTAGNFFTDEYDGTRLMKVPCYVNPTGSNFYAKPIEGLFAVVDLAREHVLRVVDEGVVPLPTDAWGYSQDEVAERMPLRDKGNPVTLSQPGGPNYSIESAHYALEDKLRCCSLSYLGYS